MKRVLRRLDSVHEKLLGTVSKLGPELYTRRPSDGEWSVSEIVHHLNLVEARVTQELENAVACEPRRVGFFRRFLPTSIVSVRLIRVKAPKGMNPVDAPERDVAIENFDRTRKSLKSFCATH